MIVRAVTTADLTAAEMAKANVIIANRLGRITRHFGALLQTYVKAAASGRPGPRAPTGDYRRSITRQVAQQGDTTVVAVGTNAPQGRRLELGFTGVDSLGRFYDQPPYPHFGPAVDRIEQPYIDALRNALDGKGDI